LVAGGGSNFPTLGYESVASKTTASIISKINKNRERVAVKNEYIGFIDEVEFMQCGKFMARAGPGSPMWTTIG